MIQRVGRGSCSDEAQMAAVLGDGDDLGNSLLPHPRRREATRAGCRGVRAHVAGGSRAVGLGGQIRCDPTRAPPLAPGGDLRGDGDVVR